MSVYRRWKVAIQGYSGGRQRGSGDGDVAIRARVLDSSYTKAIES